MNLQELQYTDPHRFDEIMAEAEDIENEPVEVEADCE